MNIQAIRFRQWPLEDHAKTTTGFDRPNYMPQEYLSAAVVNPLLPAGGATLGLWVTDLSPPSMIYVAAEATSSDTIQITLQLDEPGTIWSLSRSGRDGTTKLKDRITPHVKV